MKEPTRRLREPWILTVTDEARQSIIYQFMVGMIIEISHGLELEELI